jgi:phosphatidylinositol alpha-mannosyltransferase
MVSPYSLSIPGGVQAQVMGLSRELRAMGYEVRVLAPCDGPPPATFVTPLGNSLPTAANGSIAPLAPDLPCQLRTIRALTDEEFDVVHLHEPFLPGPSLTALLLHTAPIVGTFHSAGESASYKYLRGLILTGVSNLDHRVAVSKDARELVHRYIGGEYEILFNAVELDQYRSSPEAETAGADDLLLRAPRGAQGAGRAPARDATPSRRRDAVGRQHRAGHRTTAERVRTRRPHRLARPDDRRRQDRAPEGRGRVLRPVAPRRVVRGGADRAMAAGTPIVASSLDGYRNVATDGRRLAARRTGRHGGSREGARGPPREPATARAARASGADARRRLLDDRTCAAVRSALRATRRERGRHVATGVESASRRVHHSYDDHMVVWVVLGVVVLLAIFAIVSYNGLIRGKNQVENSWSQIDVQLKRRIDPDPEPRRDR